MISICRKHLRTTAYILLLDMAVTIVLPASDAIYALTSGPASPEFTSFEPVATTNLVDPLTGNFTYNLPVIQIPGPDGGGYAMSLSYHSGTSPEEESSWVGHGWTLNPGAINRSVRGLPDEYGENGQGTPIEVYNKTRPNWTMSGTEKVNLELFSKSEEAKGTGSSDAENFQFGLNASKYVRFNNYQGVAKTTSFGLSTGFGNLSMNRSVTGITFSANINPFGFFGERRIRNRYSKDAVKKINKGYDDFAKENDNRTNNIKGTALGTAVNTLYGFNTYTDAGISTSLSKLRGFNFNISFGAQVNPAPIPVGIEGGLIGTFSLTATTPKDVIDTYGYLNSRNGIGDYRSDYFTEKGQPFDRRDYFIGIPFSTPDNYMLTGEGLSGGFRPYRNDVGHYFPEEIDASETKRRTYGIGVEVMGGADVGVGVNLAFGNSTSRLKDWTNLDNTNNTNFTFDENSNTTFYRFYGDMGGKVEYGNNAIAKADLNASPNFPGITNVSPTLDSDQVSDLNGTEAQGSSYIEKETSGFSIYNEAGLKYTYGEDMAVRNTANLSIDVEDGDTVEENYLAFKRLYLSSNFDVDQCLQNLVVGDVKKQEHSTTSLLTSITTSDYVDLGPTGPDESDFGGWTKFDYYKKYGDAGDWYRWRIPYNGLLYSKNSISDIKDDTGFVTTGEKEVAYLTKVETKTHVAYFVTNLSNPARFEAEGTPQAQFLQGTNTERFDGLGAPPLTTEDPSANNASEKNTNATLEYLEKIVLFSKARPEVPLQTTNFRYDYSLVPNLPNNINGNFPASTTTPNSGKLTLRKVWSEFEGVVSARTSSYKFDYNYKDRAEYPDYLVADRPELASFFSLSDQYSINAQNPAYGPHLLDAWGSNQYNGSERHLNLIPWPYQGTIPENVYDPAAWQLKQITLPSGGQILLEYESKDYSYVQDRNVMAMVSLSNVDDNYDAPTYTLNLNDIGYDAVEDADKIQDLHQYLRTYFLEEFDETSIPVNGGLASILNKDLGTLKVDKRIYFKLLYALEGTFAAIENCKSEYITGYAKVLAVDYEPSTNQISIQLDGSNDGTNLVGFGLLDEPVADQGYRLTPRQACYDFYTTQRWGKYSAGCEGELEKKHDDEIDSRIGCSDEETDEEIFRGNIVDAVSSSDFAISGIGVVLGAVNARYPKKSEACMALNPELSYLKIPINKAKRGDGIRVKRVLMYDTGIESGDAAIYGQEYRYELEDGRSSGVASNEPTEMRGENPLVGFLPKEDQSWLNRLIAGKDKEQSEGPIGESLLPSASVKHARVIVENIHKGKTGSGHTIYEFYTTRDYPFDKIYDYSLQDPDEAVKYDLGFAQPAKGVDYSVLQDESYDDKLRIPTPNFTYSLDKAWASQGFRFIMNSMDGKPKSVRTYGGDYATGNTSYISSGQDFHYYEPGEKVPLMYIDNQDGGKKYYWDTPGKEMDITMERYQIKNQNLDFNFEIDVSAGIMFPPPIFVSGWLQFSFAEQKLSKYAISKVIKYPAIQKKVVSYSDNIASTTEQLAFDHATGRPVLTRTYDAYHNIPLAGTTEVHDGSIYSLNIPAHWNYILMGRKSEDSSYTNQLLASSGQVVSYGAGANPLNPIDLDTGTGTWDIKTDRVISSGANTFNTLAGVTTWMDNTVHATYNSTGATAELSNIWRLYQSYVFKGDTKTSSNRDTQLGKIYEGGILDGYTPFDYSTGATQDERWVKLSEVTKYSPHGNALEEQDVLGVYSASRFGYDFTQPIMIGQNARYDEIYFESFEDKQGGGIPNIVQGTAHSGAYSQQITSGTSILSNVIAQELLSGTGGWLKFWTKSTDVLENPTVTISGTDYEPERVAKTGEWTLYRTFIDPSSLIQGQQVNASLNFGNANAYIDDIKFNPKESQTTCFVYDVRSLRLITLFDDQHFGLYYQYNNEGQLVRKLIETEKGLQTITETQYNTPRDDRESF